MGVCLCLRSGLQFLCHSRYFFLIMRSLFCLTKHFHRTGYCSGNALHCGDDSNLERSIRQTDIHFPWFFSVSSGKYWYIISTSVRPLSFKFFPARSTVQCSILVDVSNIKLLKKFYVVKHSVDSCKLQCR